MPFCRLAGGRAKASVVTPDPGEQVAEEAPPAGFTDESTVDKELARIRRVVDLPGDLDLAAFGGTWAARNTHASRSMFNS